MKIVHIKTHKYCCDNCAKQFDWDDSSVRHGKAEYDYIPEQKKVEKVFCSDQCYRLYFEKH